MQKKPGMKSAVAVMAYAVVTVLFLVFAGYMLLAERNAVYNPRGDAAADFCETVENVVKTELKDPSAPIGVRKEYSFTIENVSSNEASLMFYTVHQFVEVRLDGELVYSLTAGENNRIGGSPSSSWAVIPLQPSDSGRQVAVTVTPAYSSVSHREVTFIVGSRRSLFMHQMKADFPQIVLASLCIVIGVLMMLAQLYFILRKATSSWDMIYLGAFSLLMGIWRVTDTRFSSIMFEGQTMALGYITLSALFIMPVPLLLFIDDQHAGKHRALLRTAALATCVVAFAALVCQVFGVKELRELLTVCHVMLAVGIAVTIFTTLFYSAKGKKERNATVFIVLIVLGSIFDMVHFYVKGNSSGMMITLVTFLICIVYQFSENILEINKKAYVDIDTELFNKNRWAEFLEQSISHSEPICIMMLDLNGLKHTNDTLGHSVGDKMIAEFAGILRQTVGSVGLLCRWGGDEFTLLVRNADREKIQSYVSDIHQAVEEYNNSGGEPQIHFACGYALSEDYPALTWQELLVKADDSMYEDKRQWYDKNSVTKQ